MFLAVFIPTVSHFNAILLVSKLVIEVELGFVPNACLELKSRKTKWELSGDVILIPHICRRRGTPIYLRTNHTTYFLSNAP